MESIIYPVVALVGLLLGTTLGWWLARGRARLELLPLQERLQMREQTLQELGQEHKRLSESMDKLSKQLGLREQELAASQARAERVAGLEQKLQTQTNSYQEERQAQEQQQASLKSTIRGLEVRLEEERSQAEEKLALLQQARKELSEQFQNLAQRIFEEKSNRFTEQNQNNLDTLLKPLREQLDGFRKKVEDVYDKESKERVSLLSEINHLKSLNQRISEDAINLTNALKGQNKAQGNWGEMILERLLESSGLQNGREYETQGSFRDEAGRLLRPDVVVHLPDEKDIVIDSKASLTAYERYVSAEEESERQEALKQHIASIQAHMKGLADKRYEELPGVRSLDFVLMFIPIEAAFLLAMETDRELFMHSLERNILLVSPSTLLVTLRTIHNIWRYEYQNRNALLIAQKAGDLYDKFVLFSESLEQVGDGLDRARTAYETSRKRLSEGTGNLVRRVEGLRELGIKVSKKMPQQLLDASEDATNEQENTLK